MTAAQRATLEQMVERGGTQCGRECGDFEAHEMDALRAALGTCGTCQHYDYSHCAAPPDGDLKRERYPFRYKLMPDDQRCTGWTAKEGA